MRQSDDKLLQRLTHRPLNQIWIASEYVTARWTDDLVRWICFGYVIWQDLIKTAQYLKIVAHGHKQWLADHRRRDENHYKRFGLTACCSGHPKVTQPWDTTCGAESKPKPSYGMEEKRILLRAISLKVRSSDFLKRRMAAIRRDEEMYWIEVIASSLKDQDLNTHIIVLSMSKTDHTMIWWKRKGGKNRKRRLGKNDASIHALTLGGVSRGLRNALCCETWSLSYLWLRHCDQPTNYYK